MPDKQKKCPSCGHRMIGAKYCPECGAEMMDEQNARLGDQFEDELAERVAVRVVDILNRKEKDNGKAGEEASQKETSRQTEIDRSGEKTESREKSFFNRDD